MITVVLPSKRRPGCPVLGCREKPLRVMVGWKKYGGKFCKTHLELACQETFLVIR